MRVFLRSSSPQVLKSSNPQLSSLFSTQMIVSFAFNGLITAVPVFCSNSILAFFAMVPPSMAFLIWSLKLFGLFVSYISFVESSASIFRTSSLFVILSRKFSFFNPLNSLYSFAVFPDQVLYITSVNVAN